jgi:hypothetical protein
MSVLEVNGSLTLNATRLLDLALPAPEEEDEPGQETDRGYWQAKSSSEIVKMADRLPVQVPDGLRAVYTQVAPQQPWCGQYRAFPLSISSGGPDRPAGATGCSWPSDLSTPS